MRKGVKECVSTGLSMTEAMRSVTPTTKASARWNIERVYYESVLMSGKCIVGKGELSVLMLGGYILMIGVYLCGICR